jgi:hypothetical protein
MAMIVSLNMHRHFNFIKSSELRHILGNSYSCIVFWKEIHKSLLKNLDHILSCIFTLTIALCLLDHITSLSICLLSRSSLSLWSHDSFVSSRSKLTKWKPRVQTEHKSSLKHVLCMTFDLSIVSCFSICMFHVILEVETINAFEIQKRFGRVELTWICLSNFSWLG